MHRYRVLAFLALLPALVCITPSQAEETARPYLEAWVDDEKVENLPLLLTTVDARINGVIADVTVTQHYTNDGTRPVEVVYVFPAPPDAAVYAVEMRVNDRIVRAEIQKKAEARATYEKAKAEGRTASLLEQSGDDFFRTSVGNLLPGDDIRVTLKYVERLIPDRGTYTFNFPIIRRTSGASTLPDDAKRAGPPRHSGEIPFDLSVDLNATVPIADISSPSHGIDVEHLGDRRARVLLDTGDMYHADRDFALNYRLGGGVIQAGLLSYQGPEANYFLLMAEPPGEVRPSQIPPREYQFVVDVSGSMSGMPMEITKYLARELLGQMRGIDQFNLHLFAGGSRSLAGHVLPATPANVDDAVAMLEDANAGGSTALFPVLDRISNTDPEPGVSRSVIVISDGAIRADKATLRLVRDNLSRQNLFALGVGNHQNDTVIDGLAHAGRGQFFKVSSAEEGETVVDDLLRYILQPVLTDIAVEYPPGITAYDVIPEHVPDVFSERPVFLVGKWQGEWNGPIRIRGISGDSEYTVEHDPRFAYDNDFASAIRLLWAREQLREWRFESDMDRDHTLHKENITRLGLEYGLATRHTSFVATDYEVRTDPETGSETITLARSPSPRQSRTRGLGMAKPALAVELPAMPLERPARSMLIAESMHDPLATGHESARSVTFVMGDDDDSGNPFYSAAKTYFLAHEPDTRLITHLRSFSAVRTWLDENRPAAGTWQRVNIVVHGFAWTGLGVPLDPDAPAPEGGFPLELDFDPAGGLPDHVVDRETEIRLYGCGLGKSTWLLDQISTYFGGADTRRPTVVSPDAPIAFEVIDGPGGRHAGYTLYRTWPVIGQTEDQWDRPAIVEAFARNHGRDRDWARLLEDRANHFRADRISFLISIPGLDRIPDRLPARQAARRQPGLTQYLDQTNMNVADLAWRYERRDNGIVIIGEGWLYLLSTPFEEHDTAPHFVRITPPPINTRFVDTP